MTPVSDLSAFLNSVTQRDPTQPEFHQAVLEWAQSIWDIASASAEYREARIVERLVEPDRALQFRVAWEDDHGRVQVNRGFRVQFNAALGPYKGGLRFHPTVTLSVLKFLGFEQIFKNALTGLPMGGGKGGSDFNPKGRSDREVMRFCQAFMTELHRHIGPDTDVPAGDIGVGGREIGYLFGQYRRLTNEWSGTLTGKALAHGGSLIRPEATGYGTVYFTREMLSTQGRQLAGMTCLISGSGNVAQYCCEKLLDLGGKPVTMSDSGGFIHDPQGIDRDKLAWIMELKNERRGRISEYTDAHAGATYHAGARPWGVPGDWAFPCATHNEISGEDAARLIGNGCQGVTEGANMPTTLDGVHAFQKAGLLFGPAKAANAGGVAVSGLEMSQNSLRLAWPREEVDQRLVNIMAGIHAQCVEHGSRNGAVDYVRGANIAGFHRVADAMLEYGLA